MVEQLAATLAAVLGIAKAAKHQSWQSTMVGSTQKICELMKAWNMETDEINCESL